MKILFLNSNVPNYVTDGLFHGLKSISGITIVDTPRLDYMFKDASKGDLMKTGSRGNTLYKLLDESSDTLGKRTFWQTEIEEYDYIIFTDLYWQSDLFHLIYNSINSKKRNSLVVVDGNDATSMFPFYNRIENLRIRPWSYLYKIRSGNYSLSTLN